MGLSRSFRVYNGNNGRERKFSYITPSLMELFLEFCNAVGQMVVIGATV